MVIIGLIASIATHLSAQTNSYAFARNDEGWGLINEQGQTVADFNYDVVFSP